MRDWISPIEPETARKKAVGMHRPIKQALLAAAAGVLVTPLLLGAVPAGAAAALSAARFTTADDTAFAGYVTGGDWRFRYVAADITMTACRAKPNQNAVASIALRSAIFTQVAQIDLSCGGGRGSVRLVAVTQAKGAFGLSPEVGDVLSVSIFRRVGACQDEFVATNDRSGRSEKVIVSTSCAVIYRHAELGATLVDPFGVSPPPKDVQLWAFRKAVVTSYNATRSTVCGPWPAVRHLARPVIAVRMFPFSPWNGCHNFGLWLKGTS